MRRVVVAGSFDDFRSSHVRLLHEAHRLGAVYVLLWSDMLVTAITGKPPKFPLAERRYLLLGNRYVAQLAVVDQQPRDLELGWKPGLSLIREIDPHLWVDAEHTPGVSAFCLKHGLEYRVLSAADLAGFPEHDSGALPEAERKASPGGSEAHKDRRETAPRARKVVVTGCFDWFHSGHVRFFEMAFAYGDLYVIVGSDQNVRLLKGEGRPLFPEAERRYLVGSVRYVSRTLISTGSGWLDAEPEILALKPDLYIVNEDGDRQEKRELCQALGVEYRVLRRAPKQGLTPRSSTELRGL